MSIIYRAYLYRTSFFILLLGCCGVSHATATSVDSIGVKFENGKKVIIHQLEARETYFGLSRQYAIPVKQIIAANGNKSLKVSDTVQIPMGSYEPGTATNTRGTPAAQQPSQPPPLAEGEYTSYKVGKRETLFTISKRFVISVESIKRANGLSDDSLKIGQILKIPNKELPPPAPKMSEIVVPATDEA